ncbi:hypothetical protein YC2023_073090 [Brassica napus]
MQLHEKLLVFDEDRKVIVAGSLNPKLVGDGSASTAIQYGRVKKIKSLTLSELNAYVITSPPEVSIQLKTSSLLCNCPVTNPNTCRLQSSYALWKLTTLKHQTRGATSHVRNAPGNFSVVFLCSLCLIDIVGRNLTPQLKLSEFNFPAKHQSFTVSAFLIATNMHLSRNSQHK